MSDSEDVDNDDALLSTGFRVNLAHVAKKEAVSKKPEDKSSGRVALAVPQTSNGAAHAEGSLDDGSHQSIGPVDEDDEEDDEDDEEKVAAALAERFSSLGIKHDKSFKRLYLDKSYQPPHIPKSKQARARIYAGMAKNELLAQCALAPALAF